MAGQPRHNTDAGEHEHKPRIHGIARLSEQAVSCETILISKGVDVSARFFEQLRVPRRHHQTRPNQRHI